MATTLDGMFGPTPYEISQQQAQQSDAAAQRFAQMSPLDRAAMLTYKGGSGLANVAAPMFGGVNVPQQQAQQQQAAMQGADLQTPEGLRAAAKKMLEIGNQKSAYLLAQKAAELEKEQAATALASRKQDFQENAILDLKHEQLQATLEQKKAQLEQAAEIAKQKSEDSRYSADQRAQAASERTQMMGMIAQMGNAIKQMAVQAKQGQQAELKPAEVLKLRQSMGKDRSAVMQTEADVEALDKSIGNLTSNDSGLSGITGIQGVVGNFPGGKAAQAQSDLDAIKGKLMGLGRTLQSQQGGKLGNMAVREWEFIQNMVANLNTSAGKEKLTQNLKEAQNYLKGLSGRMRNTYNDEYSPYFDQVGTLNLPEKSTTPSTQTNVTPGNKPPIYATNGKDRIVSTDGGVTWKPAGAK